MHRGAGRGVGRRGWQTGLLVVVLVAALLGAPAPAAARSKTTIPVGSGPNAVAVNPATNKIYVSNQVSNTVTVIDGASNATSTTKVEPR